MNRPNATQRSLEEAAAERSAAAWCAAQGVREAIRPIYHRHIAATIVSLKLIEGKTR